MAPFSSSRRTAAAWPARAATTSTGSDFSVTACTVPLIRVTLSVIASNSRLAWTKRHAGASANALAGARRRRRRLGEREREHQQAAAARR